MPTKIDSIYVWKKLLGNIFKINFCCSLEALRIYYEEDRFKSLKDSRKKKVL